jgi:hypothetical protein
MFEAIAALHIRPQNYRLPTYATDTVASCNYYAIAM